MLKHMFNKAFNKMWSEICGPSFLRSSFSREMKMVQMPDLNVMCPKCKAWRHEKDAIMFYMECDLCKSEANLIEGFKKIEEVLRSKLKDNTITVKYSLEDLEAYVEDNKFGMSDMFSHEDIDCLIEDKLDRLNLKLEWATGGTFWLYGV